MKYVYEKTIDTIKEHLSDPSSSVPISTPSFERLRFLDKLQNFPVPKDIHNLSTKRDTNNPTSDPKQNETNINISISETEDDSENEFETKYSDDNELKSHITKITKTNSQKMVDIDVAFFNSILPMVREMNDLEKLAFRSKITNALLKYVKN